MKNYIGNFSAETLPSLAQCLVVSGDSLRFTSTGRRRFAERFALVGIDISKIRTFADLSDALQESAAEEFKAFASYVTARHRPGLERDWLVAAAIGSEGEMAELSDKLARRNRLALRSSES